MRCQTSLSFPASAHLGHLVHGDGDAIDGQGWQLRVDLLRGRSVLGQRRLQVFQDGALVLAYLWGVVRLR